ncbi:MAG: permease [Candidatus Hodarchaeota archaeon]
MSTITEIISGSLNSGMDTLLDYLSFHVLLCLIPAFFIAGAMAVFIPKETVIKYLGSNTPGYISYPFAALAGFLLAVCSCTVLPLFAGIWKKGAGLGPAVTFLFSAPAINLLALTYTGSLVGLDIAFARGVLAILFAIIIGIIMDFLFPDANFKNVQENNDKFSPLAFTPSLDRMLLISAVIFGFLVVLFDFPLAFIIGIISLVIVTIRRTEQIPALMVWLVYLLFTGTSQITWSSHPTELFGFSISDELANMILKAFLSFIVVIGILIHSWLYLQQEQITNWLQETKFFVRSIFHLIIIGVFVAGLAKYFIPQELVADLLGSNTVLANLFGVLFGIFMYFPTLMEVPIAKLFLELGMAKGPLLAYLLADPELSIQSILVTHKLMGKEKNFVYVILVGILTTIAGLIFGFLIGEGLSLY